MITRRSFLKRLVSGVAAVSLLPYLPKEVVPLKSVNLRPTTITTDGLIYGVAGKRIKAGQAVYIGADGLFYPATNKHFSGISIGDNKAVVSGIIQFNSVMPDSPY